MCVLEAPGAQRQQVQALYELARQCLGLMSCADAEGGCDGAGDGISATVSIAKGFDINRIASTTRKASLGKIYSRVTYMLGLKPWEHEYKVMGLAPYAEKTYALEIKLLLGYSLINFR